MARQMRSRGAVPSLRSCPPLTLVLSATRVGPQQAAGRALPSIPCEAVFGKFIDCVAPLRWYSYNVVCIPLAARQLFLSVPGSRIARSLGRAVAGARGRGRGRAAGAAGAGRRGRRSHDRAARAARPGARGSGLF